MDNVRPLRPHVSRLRGAPAVLAGASSSASSSWPSWRSWRCRRASPASMWTGCGSAKWATASVLDALLDPGARGAACVRGVLRHHLPERGDRPPPRPGLPRGRSGECSSRAARRCGAGSAGAAWRCASSSPWSPAQRRRPLAARAARPQRPAVRRERPDLPPRLGFYVFSMPASSSRTALCSARCSRRWCLPPSHLIMGGIEYSAVARRRPEDEQRAPSARRGSRTADPASTSGSAAARWRTCPPSWPRSSCRRLGHLFNAWHLLYSTAGAVFGAGATDVHVRLPLMRVHHGAGLVIAALLVYNVWRRRPWWPRRHRRLDPRAHRAAGASCRPCSSRSWSTPTSWPRSALHRRQHRGHAGRLRPQLHHRDPLLTQGRPHRRRRSRPTSLTLRNIRLWDPQTLLRATASCRSCGPTTRSSTVDVDRYTVNGVYRQTMLSPRELNIAACRPGPDVGQPAHHLHARLRRRHLGREPGDRPTARPTSWCRTSRRGPRPRRSRSRSRASTTARAAPTTCLVKTKDLEFDYPGPNGDVYTPYNGTGGIPIGSFLNRLAFSCTSAPSSSSRPRPSTPEPHHHPEQHPRAHPRGRAVPELDPTPTWSIANGKLYWIQDAYTTSDLYPYSTPRGELNYIRNSVKILVDAYNGTMKFYVFDDKDPILKAYEAIFPELFPPNRDPGGLLEHVRYPEDCSTSRPRRTRPTTSTMRPFSTTRATNGRSRATCRCPGRDRCRPTTSS